VYEELGVAAPTGLRCLLSGRIPPSAGLSSSSALVVRLVTPLKLTSNVVFDDVEFFLCSAALTAAMTNNLSVSREELAALCARAERFIGTQVRKSFFIFLLAFFKRNFH
jgi:galactokinase